MSVASLWAATAVPARSFPPLAGDVQADVAIVGGGYTGLSAALHIAKDGRRPIVLEAHKIGFGASGRNGGLVFGKFRVSFQDVAQRHGLEAAHRLRAVGQEAIDAVEGLVAEHGIAAARFARTGYVTAAHSERAMRYQEASVAWQQATFGPDAVRLLSRGEIAEMLGSRMYAGGSFSPEAGSLHPLNYARGLAEAVAGAGIALHEDSPVLSVRRDGDWELLETPSGTVRARQVVFATNGYSGETAATDTLRRRVIPFRSAMIATAPLPGDLRRSVLPGGVVAADTKRVLRWYRMIDDRLVFGGRGAFGHQDSEPAFRALQAGMVEAFPQLAGYPVDYRWSGLVAMTLDFLPHIGRLDERRFFAMGFNGTGVALSSLMGRYLAILTRGEDPQAGLLASQPLHPIAGYPLTVPGVRIATAWYQLLDRIGR